MLGRTKFSTRRLHFVLHMICQKAKVRESSTNRSFLIVTARNCYTATKNNYPEWSASAGETPRVACRAPPNKNFRTLGKVVELLEHEWARDVCSSRCISHCVNTKNEVQAARVKNSGLPAPRKGTHEALPRSGEIPMEPGLAEA